MTRLEAIRILDPETTIEALSEIEYYAGFSGQTAKVQAVNEACVVAVEAMRRLSELESHSQALESNAPLTLDELRKMDGEPVWVKPNDSCPPHWRIWSNSEPFDMAVFKAYRRKPEEGTV